MLSNRHHYIPQFYLYGFCRTDGTFDVYDKQDCQFKHKYKTPKTVFLEKGKNTILFRGVLTDKMELHYAKLEGQLAKLFEMIRIGANSDHVLCPDGIRLLKIHIAIQFWRLPCFDKFADQYLSSRTPDQIEHLWSKCGQQIRSPKNLFNLIQLDSGFRHFFRSFMLPLCTFDLTSSIPDDMEWLILGAENPGGWSNNLCGDVPFIYGNQDSLMQFTGPIIYPLSNSHLLVIRPRSNSAPFDNPAVTAKISLLMYLQANRYVATSNRNYLERIIEVSELYVGVADVSKLQREVLAYLV